MENSELVNEQCAGAGDCCGCTAKHSREDTIRAQKLEFLTLAWNFIEAGIAIWAGTSSRSIALMGFGVDTLVEIMSSFILLWRLFPVHPSEQRERIAVRLVGVRFLLLAVCVAYEAAASLILREPADTSLVGILLAVSALVVMPLLARAKRRVAGRMNSAALSADSRQNALCAWLSAILLGGLVLNAAFHWWWADSVSALLMVPIIAKDGLTAFRGEFCTDCH